MYGLHQTASLTMRLPVVEGWIELVTREEKGKEEKHGNPAKRTLIVVAIIAVSVFVILIATYLLTAKYRNQTTGASRKSTKLPSLWNWNWKWRLRPRRNKYSSSLQDNELDRNNSRDPDMTSGSADPERQSPAPGVDRNTSIRSVMTLPAYSPAARENERILAREGERGGIDTVLEFPEALDEEEQRREEEMESLYQIRLARRQEAAEREERRRLRREARARGDQETVARLRREADAAAGESLSQILIAAHHSRDRERRVSSVQYGDLGVARHDGTRLRANSTESDHRPLLDSAASISGVSQRSRVTSMNTLHSHYRVASNTSARSVDSRASDDFEFPHAQQPSPPGIGSDDYEVVSLSHSHSPSRSASRDVSPLGIHVEIPREEPPTYDTHQQFEEAPPYESPVRSRALQLPSLERVPSIHITTEPTPVDDRGSSPHFIAR
ncbi:hypothetical protein GQ43DRAFT_282448 [Delitschia confertaspora ATCC 74209]|uniref:Uncharacterized protein n=1 Tax=Delitschia confertaspora ATCC 74209 TaxID=1513339 RepID=A0A9P4JTT2_9PLEO|nr:hypothetical protein GQ43DRAFT_282448 [Delitschia confertaspora ATCC 74209]